MPNIILSLFLLKTLKFQLKLIVFEVSNNLSMIGDIYPYVLFIKVFAFEVMLSEF